MTGTGAIRREPMLRDHRRSSVTEGLLRSCRAGTTELPARLRLRPHFGLPRQHKPSVVLEATFLTKPLGVIDRPPLAALSTANMRFFS